MFLGIVFFGLFWGFFVKAAIIGNLVKKSSQFLIFKLYLFYFYNEYLIFYVPSRSQVYLSLFFCKINILVRFHWKLLHLSVWNLISILKFVQFKHSLEFLPSYTPGSNNFLLQPVIFLIFLFENVSTKV